MTAMQSELVILESPSQAAALLDPVRARILEYLREPDSAAGAARALNVPRQRLGYHVRELEDIGLLVLVGERKVRNTMERLLQSTARSYLISPAAVGSPGLASSTVNDQFSAEYLAATGARLVQDVADLQKRAAAANRKVSTMTIEMQVRFSSVSGQHEFATALADAITGLIARHHDDEAPTGRTYRFVVAGHPTPSSTPLFTPAAGIPVVE